MEQAFGPAVLEDQREDAVGGAHGEQVQPHHSRRQEGRPEGQQQQQETEQQNEPDDLRGGHAHAVGVVHGRRGIAGDQRGRGDAVDLGRLLRDVRPQLRDGVADSSRLWSGIGTFTRAT